MGKEDVIFLSYKAEKDNATCSNIDGPRDYTEWSKWERKEQIYINTYMWNIEKLCRWTYLQSKNRNTNIENKYMDTKRGKKEVGWIGRLELTYMYILLWIK